jgi:S1-C subfamily serine protease
MLIATFGTTTAWVGKKITREGDFFILEDHGPISAQDVMEYDRQGHIVWVNDWTRAWVATRAAGPRASPASAPVTAQSTVAATSMSSHAAAAPPVVNTRSAPTRHAPSRRLLQSVVVGLIVVAVIAAVFAPRLLHGGGGQSPQEIYEKNVGSVVEIQASFANTYDILGQQTGGGQALGTGFVVSKDGYILTNAHVVSEGGQAVKTVIVVFHGSGSQGPTVEGTVVSADESTDVALIKVDPSQTPRLVPIHFGDSSKVTVGEQVVAIGNPLGLDSSLSLGVVSATNRDLPSPNGDVITGGIQTDAAINPGNSGGPLIDATGHVIGINFQINTQSGGNEGIGFAVPINTAMRVMKQMMKADAPAQ